MRTKPVWIRLGRSRHNAALGLLTAILFVAVAARYPQFASAAGLRDTFDDTSILILLALGQMLVMLTRGIDLSVAASVALTGMCVALINQAMPGVAMPWLRPERGAARRRSRRRQRPAGLAIADSADRGHAGDARDLSRRDLSGLAAAVGSTVATCRPRS